MKVKRKDPTFEVMYFDGSLDNGREIMQRLLGYGYVYQMVLPTPTGSFQLEAAPSYVKSESKYSTRFWPETYIVMEPDGPQAMSEDGLMANYHVMEE